MATSPLYARRYTSHSHANLGDDASGASRRRNNVYKTGRADSSKSADGNNSIRPVHTNSPDNSSSRNNPLRQNRHPLLSWQRSEQFLLLPKQVEDNSSLYQALFILDAYAVESIRGQSFFDKVNLALRHCEGSANGSALGFDALRVRNSNFAGDGTRRQSFRHGEAPEEERESRRASCTSVARRLVLRWGESGWKNASSVRSYRIVVTSA